MPIVGVVTSSSDEVLNVEVEVLSVEVELHVRIKVEVVLDKVLFTVVQLFSDGNTYTLAKPDYSLINKYLLNYYV